MPDEPKENKSQLNVNELAIAWETVQKLQAKQAIDEKKANRMGRKIAARLNRLI